jgi:hypothetical protein
VDANGKLPDCEKYASGSAPCICVTGRSKIKKHGEIHEEFDPMENKFRDNAQGVHNEAGVWSYGEAADAGAKSVQSVTGCPKKCIKDQIDDYHHDRGIEDSTRLRADSTGKKVKVMPSGEEGDGY